MKFMNERKQQTFKITEKMQNLEELWQTRWKDRLISLVAGNGAGGVWWRKGVMC